METTVIPILQRRNYKERGSVTYLKSQSQQVRFGFEP